ncbi:hypothetical protein [Rodentibacter ratti]|uniref:hypothetical protein n=1 Tax=Rodentibacter ratti TaxID=1906745 RepID=UPI00117B5254|nr:hypothetical protein [Rodentibacter ratti]
MAAQTGGYKAGEISYKAYDGQYKKEGELHNDVYGVVKDIIKVPLLSKLKPGAQALNSVAVDFVYEVNKPGATEKQIKAEMVGSGIGSGIGFLSEFSHLNGAPKILFNVMGGSIVSDKVKEKYEKRIGKIWEKNNDI